MTLAQHMSRSVEWYTPEYIVTPSRLVLGEIDLDPASCLTANLTVRANDFFDVHMDGFNRAWRGRVFLNCPGGRFKSTQQYPTNSSAVAWFWKLCSEYYSGRTTAAVFIGFSLELLQAAQGLGESFSPLSFPICVPKKRIKFGGAPSPTHGNCIVYLGPKPRLFEGEFKHIGQVRL